MGGHPEYSLFHCTQDILNIFGTGTNTGIDPPPPRDTLATRIFCAYRTGI